MSTMPGLASKAEKGKSKFQSLDINNLYRHSLGENLERSAQKSAAPLKHGMQSLGKVPSARRPPANLPSVKAEQNNTSSVLTTVTSESQVATAGGAGNAIVQLVQQEQSQQPQSWVGKQGTGDKIGVVVDVGGLPTATLATIGPQSLQQQPLQPQLSAHQAAIALPVTNTILPVQKQQQNAQQNTQQLAAQQQIQQGAMSVYHLTAVQQAQLQHIQMQTAAVAAAAAQAAQAQQTQGATGPIQQGANGATGPADKSWSAVMSTVNVDGHGAMVAMGAAMGLGGTVGGGGAGSHHHHHHPLHHHGMQGVGGMQQPPPYHSVQFQHEFPSLSAPSATADNSGTAGAGGNVGNGRVGNQGGMGAQQPQLPQQQPPPPLPLGGPDVQYGPGPSLRPQTEGSWMQGGGAQVRTPGQQQQAAPPVAGQGNQSAQPNATTAPGTQQMPAHFRGIMPPFMFRGGNFPPMNGHHGPLPAQHQQSMAAQQHHSQHPDGRHGHPGIPRRGGGASSDQPVEVITHRPIIREEELSRMDEMVRDMGWAAHEDIDYNQQLAFSDDDDSVIEDGGGKMQSGGGNTGGQRGKMLGMQGVNRNDHRSDRSDHHNRSASHPNHQSQLQQQQHKDSLHHHHHSIHQQHQDSANSNYQPAYGSRQQQQSPQTSSASSGNNQTSCVGGQNVSSATLTQQKSWSSAGSSSTGGSGGSRSGSVPITRRSNECDDEIAERRRQQNQAMSTVIERARQRKEEEEKRYLDSKQAANKKLQELDERSKNKREQRELDESSGTITQASVPPQPIMHSTIPVPEWEREKDNRDNRERILRESSEEKSLKSSTSDENTAITPSPSASSFHQLTQIESSRGTTYRKDNTSGSSTSSMRTGSGNTVTDVGAPPPFSRQFQTNLPPRFQKQKQQATGGSANSGGPSSLGSLGGQHDQGRYGAGKGSSPPQQQQDRGDRQQPLLSREGQRGAKEDKDVLQRERDRDMRDDRDRDDHGGRGFGGNRGKPTANSNAPSSSSNLAQGSDDGVIYRNTRYASSSSNRYSDEYPRDYDYNSNNNTGSSSNRTGGVGKSNNMTSSSSVGKELDRRGYEKQDSLEMDNMRGSRHSSSDEWGSGRDRYDRERPQRPDSRDSRASRDSRHSMESAPRHSETRDFASWSESPYEPPYEADQQHKQQHKHQQQQQSRHLAVPGPITKERLEQSSDDLKSSDKHHCGGQAHHNNGGQQHQQQHQQQRSSGLTQLKRGCGGADKKIVDDDAWTIRRGGSSSTKEGVGGTSDVGGGGGTGSAVSTAWADSMPDDKQGKQASDHRDNKKDYEDSKIRRNENRNIGVSNKGSNNWSDSGRDPATYSRNNSWTSSKKSSSNTSSVSGGGNRSDRSDRLPQYGRNQRPPSVKSGESEGSADEVSAGVDNSAKEEVTKHIKKIEKDEKNKELLRAILPEPIKKPQQAIMSDSKSKDGGSSGSSAAYIPRGEPSRHGRGGGSNSASFRGGRSSAGGGVKRMDYYGLPAASKSPFGNNQDDKEKKSSDDSNIASHITDEDKAKVQQKNEPFSNEQDKERYAKPKRSENRRQKFRGAKDDCDLVSDNSEDGKGAKRLDNQQKSANRGGGTGNVPMSGGGRKPTTSSTAGGQLGNQQQSRQQNNSEKRYGNTYNNSGRQNSSGNLRNNARKDDNTSKENDEDDIPRIEDGFQEVRNKKPPITNKKQEDVKPIGPPTATTVSSVKVPVSSGGGAIVVAPTSTTVMAAAPSPGGKVDKDTQKATGASCGKATGAKPGGPPGLSQQQIANIPSLMSVPVNPPMMKGQYDRDRGSRQNKLPPRFAKQREHRLNNQHQQQHVGHIDQQSSIHSSNSASDAIKPPTTPVTFSSDSGTQISSGGTASTSAPTGIPAGNAWDKPLAVAQLRSGSGGLVVDSDGVMVGGLVGDGSMKVKTGEVDKSGMLSECAAPVNTIIFENSNYKQSTSSPAGTAVRVPISTNRNTGPPLTSSNNNSVSSTIVGSTTQTRSIQQQMEDQAAAAAEAAVLGTLSSGKGDKGSKGDVDMMFSKDDDVGMKMDFFESEISHLTDDKGSSKNIGLARSIQQTMVGSTGGSISASTADALNIKIQSVKKVWENANDHPVLVQDDGSGFVGGFGSDHNSLDPSGAFGKGADTPDDSHEGYSSSPNQAVSSANTNVCKVKPNQQATAAAAAAAAAQAAVHSGSIVSPGNMVSVAQQQHQQQQVQVQQAQHHVAHAQAAAAAAQAAAQAVAAQAAAAQAQAVQMGHHGSTMVGHQVLGHPLSPPPPLPGSAVLGAGSCQPAGGGGGAFGTGQHLGYQGLGGTTNYNLSAIPSPPTLHQFSSSQSQLQAAVAAAVQQNSIYGNFPQMEQSHQVATARAPQYATQYANPYGIGATASSPYSTSVYLPPGGPPPPHGPPPGQPGTGAQGPVPQQPDLYQNLNNYRLAAAAAAVAASGGPFANQQSNPATVLISSSNSNSLMSASVVGKSGVGGGSGNGGGASGSGQISAIGTKAGGVGPAYTSHSHSHSQQAAQQLAYMTYDLSMGPYHMPPPPQQRGQQGGGPPPGPPPPQGSSQVQQSNSSYYNQNTGGQTGYFQQQQSSGVNTTGQQPQLGNGGAGGGLATQHAAAAAVYGLQAVANAAALFGNQSHQPISNATSLQSYGSHYLSNNMLAAMNVQQQQQQQQQQQYRSQQQYMKSSNQQQLMDQQPGSGGRQQLKSPSSQQDGLSSVFNSSPQIPSPKARQQNCKVQPQQQMQAQQQMAQMPLPSPPVSNVQHNKYNLYNVPVPPTVTNQPPPGQIRYPAPIQRPVNFQANLGSAQNTVSGNNPKHRPNNPSNRPSAGARQYYGQALNHTVNDVAKSDENTISKLSEQIVSTGGAANGTTVSTAAQKAAAVVPGGTNTNVTGNAAGTVSSDSIVSAKDTNNSNQQPQPTNKDETSVTSGIKD